MVVEETEPFLLFRRTGRTIAAVVAFGFGGGTVLMGLASTLAAVFSARAAFGAFKGYALAAAPFFLFGLILAACRRELWFVPEARAFRMLTYRPWRLRGPRVEQASLDDYRAACLWEVPSGEARGNTVVALVTDEGGERVPVREFTDGDQARAFLSELCDVTGLPRTAAREPD